ncbi:MAG: SCO family protein [Planctomycetes bacterium]|nr:SCO family protein [Planctomycetota bacterium]
MTHNNLVRGLIIVGAVLLAGCGRSQPAAVVLQSEVEPVLSPGEIAAHQIVDFSLTDSDNIEFDSRDLRGQVWVASFFFSTCPSVCREQNEIARRLCREFGPKDVRFVSITCDPQVDTPERLKDYARLYEADPEEWLFLTGELDQISQIGQESFQLGVGYRTHSDRFVAVDKWGWVRGVYDWHDPRQLDALKENLEQLIHEDSSPFAASDAVPLPGPEADGPWIRDFTLTAGTGEEFRSQDLLGDVWVASFFFTTCASTCRAQNDMINHLHREFGGQGVKFVCITCDPETDTVERLSDYGKLYNADPDEWIFLTGDMTYIRRIGSERFDVPVDRRAHVDRLIVVDKAGEVRGKFNWHETGQVARLKALLSELLQESAEPAKE